MKRHVKRAIEHMMGPTGSIIVHIIVVVILVKLVFFDTSPAETDVEVIIMEPESVDLEEIKQELKELEDIEVVDVVTPPDVSLETEVPPEDVEDFENTEPDVDFAALDVIDSVQSPLVMKGMYAGRSAAGRAGALGKHSGKWGKYTEMAVLKALEWLKSNQNADGSWDKSAQAGMTGLGLLTFLAHGETPTSEKYGPTVEKAIRYLVDSQNDAGTWKDTGGHHVYGHAIAAYAISEAYGLTQIPSLKTAMDKAAAVIVRGQQTGGGWDYDWKKTARRDTSVSGWQIQALKAAKIAKADVPGLDQALKRSITDLKKSQKPSTGRFGYSDAPGSGSIGMTGVGVLCMQLLGYADDPACEKGIDYMNGAEIDVNWKDAKGGHELYGWYYITQAKFHHGKGWNSWNSQFAKAFTRAQNEDGSWTPPGSESKKGKVYGTTFAALTLQVYYRLLPTYQTEAVKSAELVEDEAVDEEDEEEDFVNVT